MTTTMKTAAAEEASAEETTEFNFRYYVLQTVWRGW